MSQPETQPEGAGRDRRGELLGHAFPLGDWGEPAERLDELYQWVEQRAVAMVDWYLADRTRKRRAARVLRAGTGLGVVGGAVLPLLELAGVLGGVLAPLAWGYLSLLGAVLCAGCDRWFGLTSGWMRDVATAQAIQRRLEALQYEWAAESVREVLGPAEGTAAEAAERCLGVLRRFSEDVSELVRAETGDWMVEFRTGPVPGLSHRPPQPGWPRRQSEPSWAGAARFTLPPGTRPNMPRQRPPESPR
ncbi:SLATT domain-containing protein [Streptomyces durbertensis]|uniref:SLATT domain-containing protein n=1 Tax=Streptomyces durbertensis TaxID=2448886 RepID=A0ABR6EEH8_9ACTN|nr:SLATT domain-containing protein [Streptomyces durbertensis]MBB1243732.1 SLATT domain-containing protein [Streptomyces durbertensis]